MSVAGHQQVDQIIFAWSERTDVAAVASSMDDGVQVEWNELLRRRVRMQDAGLAVRPETSMCLLQADRWSAVLHRARGPGNDRTDVCHALVDPAGRLTPKLVLGLSDWRDWRSPDKRVDAGRLDRLDLAVLTREYEQAAEFVRTQACDQQAGVESLLAHVLSNGTPVSVLLNGQRDNPSAVLWGLFEILDAIFGTESLTPSAKWTFSTWEVQHHTVHGELPRVIFLPELPPRGTAFTVDRAVVRLGVVPDDNPYAAVARCVATKYAEVGTGLREWLHANGVLAKPEAPWRLSALHALAKSPDPRRPAQSPDPRRTVSRYGAPEPAPSRPITYLSASLEPAARDPDMALRHQPVPHQPAPGRQPIDAVTSFGHARTADEVWQRIAAIQDAVPDSTAAQRAHARSWLVANGFWLEHLNHTLGSRQNVRDALRVLVSYAVDPRFGDGELDDSTYRMITDRGTPPEALHALAEHAVDNDRDGQLAAWFGVRWLHEHGFPVGRPRGHGPSTRPRASTAGRVRRFVVTGRGAFIAGAGLATLLWLGYGLMLTVLLVQR